MRNQYDVVVVGGGAAGLSAALTLARARRSVLVVDAGDTRNARAEGVHGYLGREGTPPAELMALGRDEVTRYGGEVVVGEVERRGRVPGDRPCVEVRLVDGRTVTARRLVLATGMVDDLPDVPGLAERWGRDVLHCPYCHGLEIAGEPIALLGTGPSAVDEALLLRQWSEHVTLVLHDMARPDADEAERLDALDVTTVEGPATGLDVDDDDRLVGVRLASGVPVACRAVVVQPLLRAREDLLAQLGLRPTVAVDGGGPVDRHLGTDPAGRTAVPGVWAAGNVRDPGAQVVTAAADGLHVATAVNTDLVMEDVDAAVRARRSARATG